MNKGSRSEEASRPAAASFRAAPIVAVLFGTLFLASVDNQLLIPLLPVLSADLGESIARLGWLFSSYALAAGLANLALGPLTDRFGRVVFLKAGLAGFALLATATSFSATFGGLFWLRGATGAAAGVLATCTTTYVGDAFPYARRGRIMGIVLSAYFAALVGGIPLSAWIADRWEWRSVFLASAALAVLLLALALVSLPPDGAGRSRGSRLVYRRLLHRRDTLAALLVSFLVSGGTLAFYTYIAGYLSAAFGLEAVEISFVFVIAGVAALIASPVSGWLADRWTKASVFLLFNSLLVIPLLLLVSLDWGLGLTAALFAISLCIAFRQTALQTLQTQLVGDGERGSFLALRGLFSQFGISLSVLVAGQLYASSGYAAVTVLASALTLAASLLFRWRIREPE